MKPPGPDNASRRSTGHPAKDSGSETRWLGAAHRPYIRATWEWMINGRKGHMPIRPDDYARHWALEGPRRPD